MSRYLSFTLERYAVSAPKELVIIASAEDWLNAKLRDEFVFAFPIANVTFTATSELPQSDLLVVPVGDTLDQLPEACSRNDWWPRSGWVMFYGTGRRSIHLVAATNVRAVIRRWRFVAFLERALRRSRLVFVSRRCCWLLSRWV